MRDQPVDSKMEATDNEEKVVSNYLPTISTLTVNLKSDLAKNEDATSPAIESEKLIMEAIINRPDSMQDQHETPRASTDTTGTAETPEIGRRYALAELRALLSPSKNGLPPPLEPTIEKIRKAAAVRATAKRQELKNKRSEQFSASESAHADRKSALGVKYVSPVPLSCLAFH